MIVIIICKYHHNIKWVVLDLCMCILCREFVTVWFVTICYYLCDLYIFLVNYIIFSDSLVQLCNLPQPDIFLEYLCVDYNLLYFLYMKHWLTMLYFCTEFFTHLCIIFEREILIIFSSQNMIHYWSVFKETIN